MPNTDYEAYVRLEYDSGYAPHTMEIPTNSVNLLTTDETTTEIDDWIGGTIPLSTMVAALLTDLAPFYLATQDFNVATFFTKEPGEDFYLPRFSWALTFTGTNAGGSWNQATQLTLTIRTAGFNVMKLVMLDTPLLDDFSPVRAAGVSADIDALVADLTSDSSGWAGRDATQPKTFLQASKTMNAALQRAYRLT